MTYIQKINKLIQHGLDVHSCFPFSQSDISLEQYLLIIDFEKIDCIDIQNDIKISFCNKNPAFRSICLPIDKKTLAIIEILSAEIK